MGESDRWIELAFRPKMHPAYRESVVEMNQKIFYQVLRKEGHVISAVPWGHVVNFVSVFDFAGQLKMSSHIVWSLVRPLK